MFTVLIKYVDGSSRIVPSEGEIYYKDCTLFIDDSEERLERGDSFFVTNRDGNTVWTKWVK